LRCRDSTDIQSSDVKGHSALCFMRRQPYLLRRLHVPQSSNIIRQWPLQCLRLVPPRAHQTSRSSSVIRMTGMALGWMAPTSAFGSVVRNANVVGRLAFLHFPYRRPVGPDAGEAGEGPGLVEGEPDVAALRLVEFAD
jgi:hypothetical protein